MIKNQNLKQLCILFILALQTTLFSATLQEVNRITIPLGPGHNSIGLIKGGGEHWKPLFFSADEEGNIHIPDFYKARIAVFDPGGKLIKTPQCPEGLSPAMNWFTRTPRGTYLTYSKGVLYHLDKNGKALWKKEFGLGAIPSGAFANTTGIYLIFSGKKSLIINYIDGSIIGMGGTIKDGTPIPMVFTPTGEHYPLKLEQWLTLNKSTQIKEGDLIRIDSKKQSIWQHKENNRETYYLYSPEGKLIFTAYLMIKNTGFPGSGFGTSIDNNLRIYKNLFYENHMEIVSYEMKK